MYTLCKSIARRPQSPAFPNALVINQIEGGTEPDEEKKFTTSKKKKKKKSEGLLVSRPGGILVSLLGDW